MITFLPIGLSLLAYGYDVRRRRFDGNVALVKYTRAYKQAARDLKTLGREGDGLDPREFYDRLSATMRDYLGGKTDTPPAGMVIDKLEDLLSDRSVPTDRIRSLTELMSRAEMVRFAPTATEFDLEGDLKNAHAILDTLEEVL